MTLRISKRLVNSTIILELKGRITLGEGHVLLREAVQEVVDFDKPRSVILDISGVRYIDSAGIGELVHVFTNVKNKIGIGVSLCHPLIKVMDLLQITKLISVFNIATSVEQVLSGVPSEEVKFACPVDTCQAWSLMNQNNEYQVCARCNSRYKFEAGRIDHMLMDSYPGEVVSFNPLGIPIVTTSGTVDLFVTNMFERAWLTMDVRDRSAILDLTSAREVTAPAIRQLLRIVENTVGGIGLIVLPASHPLSSLEHSAIYTELSKARDLFRKRPGSTVRTTFLK
jgi:anti-sigma B factor antagonist